MKISVILPAAGIGRRFAARSGHAHPSKTEHMLCDRPVFQWSLELFENRREVCQILLAVGPGQIDLFRRRWGDKLAFGGVSIVPGADGAGAERWQTVLRALERVSPEATHVAVHDAVRPLATRKLIDRVFEAASHLPAVIPGVPVNATLKRVVADAEATARLAAADPATAILGADPSSTAKASRVIGSVDRSDVIEVQTPQVFEVGLLRRAYERAGQEAASHGGRLPGVTDDAALVEALGVPVHAVEGEVTNLKITRPADAEMAEAILAARLPRQAAETARRKLLGDDED